MRKMIILFLSAIALQLNAQYIVKNNGLFVVASSGGGIIKSQGIPSSPDPDPPEESDYIVYFQNDFDRAPNSEYTETMLNADYTSTGFVDCTDNIDIYNWGNGSDTVFRGYFETGHCCNCWPSNDIGNGTGVGTNFSLQIMDDNSGWDSAFNSVNICYSDPFEIGDLSYSSSFVEMKTPPGWRSEGGSNDAVIRIRIDRDDNLGYYKYFSWLYRPHETSSSRLLACGSKSSDTIHMSGECYNFTIFVGNNDPGQANGTMAFYLDGELVDYQDTIEFTQTGEDWDKFECSMFTGGSEQWAFASEVDQYALMDDHVIWMDTSLTFNKNDGSTLPTTITFPPACGFPQPYYGGSVGGIGNSIVDDVYDKLNDTLFYKVNTLAAASEKILDQRDEWNLLTSTQQADFDYVFLAVGVNDIAQPTDSSTMVSRYNTLLSQINTDISDSCEVVMFTMTPARGSQYVSDAEHEVLKAVNTWIETSPTYVDIVSTANWDDLLGSGDSLNTDYSTDRIHLNADGEDIIIQNIMDIVNANPHY